MFGHDKHQDEDNNNQTAPVVDDSNNSVNDTAAPQQDDAAAVHEEISLPTPEKPNSNLTFEVPSVPTPDATLTAVPNEVTHGGIPANLSSLRRDALLELSPLVDHLDQSVQEKYDIAKMMYEETKDQNMLTALYEAARNLPDEKAKAAAIYDVIKKINELH